MPGALSARHVPLFLFLVAKKNKQPARNARMATRIVKTAKFTVFEKSLPVARDGSLALTNNLLFKYCIHDMIE